MNRLKILLITAALITGSSALASAEEQHYQSGFSVQVRLGGHAGDRDRYVYYGDGDRDRDDGYFYRDRDDRWRDRDDHYFNRKHRRDRDDRWQRDRDDRWGHDRDDDDDRR